MCDIHSTGGWATYSASLKYKIVDGELVLHP